LDDVGARLIGRRLVSVRCHDAVRPAERITRPVRVPGYGQPERTQRDLSAVGVVEPEP